MSTTFATNPYPAQLEAEVASGFRGRIYPVNPAAVEIQDLAAYSSVEATPDTVDLSVVAVPAARALEVADQCGRKGVQALLVLTAGFGEDGDAGRQRQAELLRICRAYGMRLIGPNCIGIINTDPHAPMNASFGPLNPAAGRLGLASQSGAVGLAAIDFGIARNLGFSSVVSMQVMRGDIRELLELMVRTFEIGRRRPEAILGLLTLGDVPNDAYNQNLIVEVKWAETDLCRKPAAIFAAAK